MTSAPRSRPTLADPEKVPQLLHGRARPTRDASRSCWSTCAAARSRRDQAVGRLRLFRHRVRARSDRGRQGAAAKLGLRSRRDHHQAGAIDVSTEVIKLRRAKPDFVIFHGYVLAPIPEFVAQCAKPG